MSRSSGGAVVIGIYQVEHEAELARAVLEANGVPAVVQADNAGGMLPMLQPLFQIRVMVAAEDAALARRILDERVDEPVDDRLDESVDDRVDDSVDEPVDEPADGMVDE